MKISDVKFLKMTRKDYADERIGCNSVENFPEWRVWMRKYWGPGVSRQTFDKGCLICQDNRERFTKHFGKCAFTYYNGEFYFRGWLVDLGTAQVIALTAKDKGSCYEVVESRDGKKVPVDINRVLEFLDMITELPE